MRKPQDSDIFGTKSISYAPRINNEQKVDPNAGFQARMDAQYDAYTKKIGSSHRGMFDQKAEQTKVNQNVDFDENYHHTRKEADLQSTIFYQPSLPSSRVTQRPRITQRFVPKHAYNMKDPQTNFGRKQTLQRQVKQMPQNTTNFKGNSSNIFGYDQHIDRNGVKNKIEKLIPYQMQWNQHDSVRHQDWVGGGQKQETSSRYTVNQVLQSKSEVFTPKQAGKKVQQNKQDQNKSKQNNPKTINMLKKPHIDTNPQQNKPVKPKTQTKTQSKPQPQPQPTKDPTATTTKVQILISKGWSSNIMQQLSKFCKLNSTKILSINFEQGGKGNLVLEKSKRWENVTDWLRKDAKLKIRVLN